MATPEEIALLEQKLGVARAAAPVLARVGESSQRLLNHPALAINPATLPGFVGQKAAQAGLEAFGLDSGAHSTTKLQHGGRGFDAPGNETQLRPLNVAYPEIEASKTLDPRYAQLAKVGAGGGGPGLGGLKSAWDEARGTQLADYDTDKMLARQLGINQSEKTAQMADLETLHAQRQERDAQIQQEQEAKTAEQHERYLARNRELADDSGKQKVDPGRLFRDKSTGERFAFALGGVLGGALSGLTGGPNEFMSRVDKMIDRDIAAQEKEIDNKKASLSARNTVYGQMLQETGDRRLAAQQTRNLMYEAAKQKLAADAERLGIPSVKTQAEQAAQIFQHKQDELNVQFKHDAYATAQAQAAAAAAAQRQAEEKAGQRQMQVAELGLKKDAQEIERAKALGVSPQDLNKQVQELGKALSDKELASGRANIDQISRRMDSAAPGEGLAGVGRLADARDSLKYAASPLNPLGMFANKVLGLSAEERVSRNDWESFKLDVAKQLSGSGVSDKEREKINSSIEGAKTPAEQRNAINKAREFFQQQEARTKAGYDPRAVQIFEQRLQGYKPELPSTAKVGK